MKLRLPVRLKLAVLAGLRSVVQATLASGFLAVGAVFFSFSAQAEDDPVALEVAEDEDEAAVPVDDEAPATGLCVSAAELNDSQAAALAEAEQEHAAELGINATSSAVSQAAIEAQDAVVSPAQAAGGSHADSFAAVPAADSPALTLPAAEGAVAPSLCAEGAADFVTDYAPIKTASVAVLPQASTSLTLSEDVVMASSPVAEAAQTSSSSTSAAVSSSSSSGGAVAGGGGAAGGGGGSSASFSASASTTGASSSSPAARSFSLKMLGSTAVASETESTGTSESASSSSTVAPTVFQFEGNTASRSDDGYHSATGVTASGTIIYENSGQKISTAYGNYYLARDLGQAVNLTNGYIKLADGYWKNGGDCELSATSSFTITTFVKFNSISTTGTDADEQTIFSTGGGTGNGFAFGVQNGKFDFLRKGKAHDVAGGIAVKAGEWYNLTISYDGTTATFYLNGESFATLNITGAYAPTSDVKASIGSSTFDNGNNRLEGLMADLRIYSGESSEKDLRNAAGLGILWQGAEGSNVWNTTKQNQNWKTGEGLVSFTSNESVVFAGGDNIATTVVLGEDATQAYVVGITGKDFTFSKEEAESKGEAVTRTLQVQELNIASGASLTTESGITLSGSDLNLAGTLNSVGSTTFTGLANVSGSVNVTGGSLTLSGTNNFTDGATLSKGESWEMNLSGTNHVSGTLNITSGTVDFSGATTLSSGTTLSVNDGAQLLLSGTTDVSGTLTVSQGSVQLTGTNTLAAGTTFSLSNTSQVSLSGTTVIAGDLTVSGGALELGGTITNNGSQANLKVGDGGSYSVVVAKENKLTYDGFDIWKEVDSPADDSAAVLSRSNVGRISLYDTEVTYANVSLRKVSTDGKLINATLTNVAFTNTGDAETDFAGTATFSSLTNEGTNLKVSGTATINGELSTGSTITNTGTINFGENATVELTSLDALVGRFYDSDPSTLTNSGYLLERVLISGGTSRYQGPGFLSAIYNGGSYVLKFGDGYVSLTGSGQSDTYYINSGDSLEYGADTNSLASDTTKTIVLNGGTLEIGSKKSLGKATVLQKDSSLKIQGGATFNASNIVSTSSGTSEQIATNGMTLTLTGEGTYSISKGSVKFNQDSLNVTLGSDWTGTVQLHGGSGDHNLSQLRNGSLSTIEMYGVSGWTTNWSGTEAANIKLTDGTTAYAWTNGAYTTKSDYNPTSTFSGTWSGDGTFCASTDAPNAHLNYTYKGDISGWNGEFRLKWSPEYATILTFSGSASDVNASIYQESGTLNVTASATNGTVFSNAIKVSSLTATTSLTLNAKKGTVETVETADQISGDLNANRNSVIVGSNVTLTVEGVTTAGAFTNSGKTTLRGNANISGVLKNSGILSIGSEERPAEVIFGGVVTNTGTLTLNVSLIEYQGDVSITGLSGTTFRDERTSDTANGFLQAGTHVFMRNEGTGTISLSEGITTVRVNGVDCALTKSDDGSTYSFTLADTNLADLSGSYYLNSGTLEYGADTNETAAMKTETLVLNGGGLSLTTSDIHVGVGLSVAGVGSTVTIGSGRTLDEGIVSVDGGTLTVSGSGTYVLEVPSAAVSALSLKAGVSLANDWAGTVWLGSGMKLTGATLDNVANANSTVTFNGVSGYLATGEQTFSQNIVLVDDGGIPALSFNSGNNGDSRTFSGNISGSGTWVRSMVQGVDAGEKQTYKFTGDVSGWTGLFDNQVNKVNQVDQETAVQVDQETAVEFSGNATEMNVALRNSGSGTLALSTAGESEKAFHAGVEVSSVSLAGGAVSFLSNVSTTGNFAAESAVTFGDKASIGETLSVSGAVTVASTSKLAVAGTATLGALTLEAGASAKFSDAVTVSGAMSVADGATLALSSAVSLGGSGSLTLAAGSRTVVSGWTVGSYTNGVWTDGEAPELSESGIVTQGYKGGALYTVNADRTDAVRIADGAYFMKDGAAFLYSTSDISNNRIVLSETTEDGVTTVTVGIKEACFYNVATGHTKSLTADVANAQEKADYVYINDGGTLTDVSDDTIKQYGISAASGVVGQGTIRVADNSTLTDGGALSTFTGTVSVGAGATFASDGSVSRRVTITGGTYHATDSQTLSGVTFTNSDSGVASKLDVDGGKSVVLTSLITSGNSLEKLGEGTLTIKDTQSSSAGRKNLIAGNLTITKGVVVISTFRREIASGDNNGVVGGTITMDGGTVLTLQGIDCLGNASSATGTITLKEGSADALTTINFARNGTDATETQHVTLSTTIVMQGNTLMTGISMNAYGKGASDGDQGRGSIIRASGTNNTIQNTFKLRENAYFDVDADGELTLSGNIEMFSGSSNMYLVKQGDGTLIFSGENATLYALNITNGSVDFAGLTHFVGTNDNSLQMSSGTEFRVRDGGMFVHGGWNYENSDGTTDAGIVSASGVVNTKPLLSDAVTIFGMKLTKTGDAVGTVSARLNGVQLIQSSTGELTIGNATDGQHLTSLTVERGSVVLNTATVDSATVREGASLTLSAEGSVTLGSTITNMGSVTLAGSIIVENVEGLRPAGLGFADEKIGEGTELTYNGFNMGESFYIVYATGAGSTNVADGMEVTYNGKQYALAQDGATASYLFKAGGDTLYYINNNITANLENTTYVESTVGDAKNSMYIGKANASVEGGYEETSGIVLNTAGVVLTLGSDLKEGITNGSGIKLNYSASIDLKGNVTLSQDHVSAKDGVYASITGSGTYDLGGTTRQAYSTGLDNPSKWTGTVVASGTADQMDAQYLGNTKSTLEFKGVSGTLLNTNNQELEYRMKIKLTDVAAATESETAKFAMDIISANGDKRLFSNTVSGDGNMKMSGASETAVQDITFSGDISGWTGAFEAGQGTVNLTLTGAATEVNAGIHKSGTSDILNISIDGSATRTFNKVVSGDNLMVTAGNESTRIILTEGGNVTTSAVLTENNAILEVRDAAFIVWNGAASFAANGSSGIDIADKSGVVTTTIRTYVPTVASAQTEEDAGAAPLNSVCGTITNGAFRYDAEKNRAIIASNGQSTGRIENTIIDLAEGTTLELSNMVLADTVKITDASAKMISTNNVVELGSNNAKVNTTAGRDLGGVTLQKTGSAASAEGALTNVSGKVYTIDFTGIQNVEITSGTLTFDFNAYSDTVNGQKLTGFELFYELGKTYDYIAVNFAADSADSSKATIQYANLKVQSQITNGQGATATSTGYYIDSANGTATSGVVVYFDALALPEPTTSTLALLALTALCVRRRRPQPTR